MIRAALMLTPFVLLAACGETKQDDAKGKQPSADASAPDKGIKLQPGKWQASSELIAMEIPGVPAEVVQQNIGQTNSFENCITAEQAAKPGSDFFAHPDNKSAQCESSGVSMVGGVVNGTVKCAGGPGSPGPATMTIAGKYQPASYDITVTMQTVSGKQGEPPIRITARTIGKRVGECTPG